MELIARLPTLLAVLLASANLCRAEESVADKLRKLWDEREEETETPSEYVIDSESDCSDESKLKLMELGPCDQDKYGTFIYKTVDGKIN